MRSLLSLRRFFAVKKFTKSHEWIEYFPETQRARVGITNYAQQQLGEIIHIEFPSVGKAFNSKDSAVVVQSVKIAADVYTPVSGKVTLHNGEVQKNPSLVNEKAEESWLFEIHYSEQAPGLLSEQQYKKTIS